MADEATGKLTVRMAMRTEDQAKEAFPTLRYFEYKHLPAELQMLSMPFRVLAYEMATALPAGPEVAAGLRKLLEAKDCFVRAALP